MRDEALRAVAADSAVADPRLRAAVRLKPWTRRAPALRPRRPDVRPASRRSRPSASPRISRRCAPTTTSTSPSARRDPRAPRRERRRQVDAGQDPLRRAAADRGRDPLEGQAGRRSPTRPRRAGSASAWCSSTSRCSRRLTVAENIALALPARGSFADAHEHASRKVSREYGLPLDPDAIVADLSVGERQRVEIVRCLLQEPKLIIMDEPTSVLTPQEADELFVTLERLASEGRLGPLHQPPPRGGARALPPRHDPPPRQGRRRMRPAAGDRRRASRA